MARAKKPILLIGHSGMLGRAWRKIAAHVGIDVVAPPRLTCDLTQPETIRDSVTSEFMAVVNAAAYTDVDRCETERDLAHRVNGYAVGELADRCAELDLTLVHFSTDYVFDGVQSVPYAVDFPRNPINAYGESKALGEELIERSGVDALVIRSSWLYAPWGSNFLLTMRRLLRDRESVNVVDDQRGRPTSVEHLTQCSWRLLSQQKRGVYHVTDGGDCTWYEFAREIGWLSNAACDIRPCSSQQFPRLAKRPAFSVLDIGKTESEIGPLPDWRLNVNQVVSQLN